MNENKTWKPIADSPKYPLDSSQNGPHFLAMGTDGYIHEMWWSFPQKGSQAYAENHAPQIVICERNGIFKQNPQYYMDLESHP